MFWRRLRYAGLFAWLLASCVWLLLFFKTGLPGQFSTESVIHVKGSAPTDQSFACIAGAGALKLGLEPCSFIQFVWNYTVFAGPYFLFSLFLGGSGNSQEVFWSTFLISLVLIYFLLGKYKK